MTRQKKVIVQFWQPAKCPHLKTSPQKKGKSVLFFTTTFMQKTLCHM